jgi:hypothetical protein
MLLTLLAASWSYSQAAPGAANFALNNRVLMVDSSSIAVDGGKATLTVGALKREHGVYSGAYKVSVFPYFFKNERGRLAIVVSDKSLADIDRGKITTVIGTATKSGRGGICRHVDATATPTDINCGTVKLWFASGNKTMIFEPRYHFSEKATAAFRPHTMEADFACQRP